MCLVQTQWNFYCLTVPEPICKAVWECSVRERQPQQGEGDNEGTKDASDEGGAASDIGKSRPLTSGSSYSSPNKLLPAGLSSGCKTNVPWVSKQELSLSRRDSTQLPWAGSQEMPTDLKPVKDVRAECPAGDKAGTRDHRLKLLRTCRLHLPCPPNQGKTHLKWMPAWIRPETHPQAVLICSLTH